MTRFKNFGEGTRVADIEPLEFEVGGKRFTAKPALQGAALLEFIASTTSGEDGSAAETIMGFFKQVLPQEDMARFNSLITSDDVIIEIEVLSEIAGWLVSEYTNRPTQPQLSSVPGP